MRFVSVKKGTAGTRARDRWAALPLDAAPPPGVTVAVGVEQQTHHREIACGDCDVEWPNSVTVCTVRVGARVQ